MLQHNIALAVELGTTIVRVNADRPADGLIAFAKREGITRVIFGKTARSRCEILLKGSTLNPLSRRGPRRRDSSDPAAWASTLIPSGIHWLRRRTPGAIERACAALPADFPEEIRDSITAWCAFAPRAHQGYRVEMNTRAGLA